MADSYFKEGGTSNLTQSIQEYNDFQTFFPFLDEAAYAQMQIGLAHYHMMEKADRDKTQGEAAEDAFQAFLLKYPTNALAPKATQYLRDVQEVLADGEYKVAYFYYAKLDYRASAARLVELTDRYPLYSQNDEALWLLGDVYERAKTLSKSEDDKNHWGDLAAKCYDKIVRDYPMSKLVPAAKIAPEGHGTANSGSRSRRLRANEAGAVVSAPASSDHGVEDADVDDQGRSGFYDGGAWRNAAAESPERRGFGHGCAAPRRARPGVSRWQAERANSQAPAETGTEPVTPEDARTGPAAGGDGQPSVGVEIISTGPDSQPGYYRSAPGRDFSRGQYTPGNDGDPGSRTPMHRRLANAAVASPNATGVTMHRHPAAARRGSGSRSSSTPGCAPRDNVVEHTPTVRRRPKRRRSIPARNRRARRRKGMKKIIPW